MRWMFRNAKNRLSFALKSPSYAVRSLVRELFMADERFLGTLTGVSPRQIRSFLDEPLSTPFFGACLRDAHSVMRGMKLQSADLFAKKVLLQYITVRAFRPNVVVETGVANGVSSTYLLLALEKNGRGKLHSIGLNDPLFLPVGKPLGWIVPESLRSRWNLIIGDSRELLPKLLSELGTVDVFIHDSLHTYEHMQWEYRTAYPFLRSGGLLLSDDAAWNSAFEEFSREVGAKVSSVVRGVGFLQKMGP